MKQRLFYLFSALVALVLCAVIVLFFRDQEFIRGFLGDFLVVFFIFFVLRIFLRKGSRLPALLTLALAWFVEGLQYFQLATRLGLKGNPLAQLLLGSVFDPWDLVAYTLGTALVWWLDRSFFSRLFAPVPPENPPQF